MFSYLFVTSKAFQYKNFYLCFRYFLEYFIKFAKYFLSNCLNKSHIAESFCFALNNYISIFEKLFNKNLIIYY